jgi:hypothetical protein
MYQFVHVESYSRTAPKSAVGGGKEGRSVGWVIDEARRAEGATPHVVAPLPPVYLYGQPLEQLEGLCEEWAATMTDAKGRKLRKDALCLAAGVISAPHDIEPAAWASFRADSIKWLQAKYGAGLRTVVEHTDESHPHLHFYCVPQPGERFESVHQGKAAAAEAKAQGKAKGLQNQAYKAAMRTFQDEFYDRVGIDHGFTRIGPGKRRLTREEWQHERVQAAAAAAAIGKADEATKTAQAEAKAVAASALKQADRIMQEAQAKGFQQGVADSEKLQWWQRLKLFVRTVTQERDQLQVQVEKLEKELRQERAAKGSLTEKAQEWYRLGRQYALRLRKLEPALEVARGQAKEGRAAIARCDTLQRKLDEAEGRAQHWQAMADAYRPKDEPSQPRERQKPAQEAELSGP